MLVRLQDGIWTVIEFNISFKKYIIIHQIKKNEKKKLRKRLKINKICPPPPILIYNTEIEKRMDEHRGKKDKKNDEMKAKGSKVRKHTSVKCAIEFTR